MSQVETHEITVQDNGIHCVGCKTRIESVLSRMPGVREINADQVSQKIRLTLDPGSVSIQDVKEKLDDMGYSTEQPYG